ADTHLDGHEAHAKTQDQGDYGFAFHLYISFVSSQRSARQAITARQEPMLNADCLTLDRTRPSRADSVSRYEPEAAPSTRIEAEDCRLSCRPPKIVPVNDASSNGRLTVTVTVGSASEPMLIVVV